MSSRGKPHYLRRLGGLARAYSGPASPLRALELALADTDTPHVLIGGLAVVAGGYDRHTDDIDVLVAPQHGLERLRMRLNGSGFRSPPSRTGTILRALHRESGVEVELLVAQDEIDEYALRTSRPGIFAGQAIRLPSSTGLILLKLKASLDPKRRAKAMGDVLNLLAALPHPNRTQVVRATQIQWAACTGRDLPPGWLETLSLLSAIS